MSNAEMEKEKKYHFVVDGKKYETTSSQITGAAIKAQAGVPPNYQLYLEAHSHDPDKAISDGETVPLDHGTKHFYAVPPATFG